MDPVTAVQSGFTGGAWAGEAVLKFDAQQYEEKIAELESLKRDLDGHLEVLSGMKGEIPGFSLDEHGDRLAVLVQKWIDSIGEANRKIDVMKKTLENAKEQLEGSLSEMDSKLDDANSLVDAVQGAAGSISGVADL